MPVRKPQIRQRLGISELKRARALGPTAQRIVKNYHDGRFSAADVGTWAGAAAGNEPELIRFATKIDQNIRTRRGKVQLSHKNTSRGMLRAMQKRTVLPPNYYAELPGWDQRAGKACKIRVAFQLPHETLQAVVPEGEEAAYTATEPGQENFRERLEMFAERAGLDLSEDFWACVSLWGDSAQYTVRGKDSVYLLTWRLVTGRQRRRYWCFVIPKRQLCACGCHGRHTLDVAFEIVAWSFRCLLLGLYPETDHLGFYFSRNTWRGRKARERCRLRIRGLCVAKTGDWAWFKQACGLCGWNDGHRHACCWLCGAQFVIGSYDDASGTAHWRSTIHDVKSFWIDLHDEKKVFE